MSPGGGSNVSHLYNDRSDGKGLQEHFDLSGECGCKTDTACLGDMPQHRNIDFPQDKNSGDRPVYNGQGGGAEAKQLRLADYGKAYECSAYEDFINKRVDHSAELAGDIESAGNYAVHNIREACNNKENKGEVEEPRSVGLCKSWRVEHHRHEYDR